MMVEQSVNLSDQKTIQWDLSKDQSYGDYLQLDRLLDCQHPRTDEHDEMLFVVIHQVMELWIKQANHEISLAIRGISTDRLDPAFKAIARVARIQQQMSQAWDVLSTLTPADYLSFRHALGPASGFQSAGYRILEFSLGNKNAKLVDVHKSHPERHKLVTAALNAPSLYDECIRLLARRGFSIDAGQTERDWSKSYTAHPSVEAAWTDVYEDTERHWDLYDLAEKLMDLEHRFQIWRFSHVKQVERVIGQKRGTGGTTGVSYLHKALELKFFPELWALRTNL